MATSPGPKTLDAALKAAFKAGQHHGIRQATLLSSDYATSDEDAYRRWQQEWTGLPHERPDCNDRCYGEPCIHRVSRHVTVSKYDLGLLDG